MLQGPDSCNETKCFAMRYADNTHRQHCIPRNSKRAPLNRPPNPLKKKTSTLPFFTYLSKGGGGLMEVFLSKIEGVWGGLFKRHRWAFSKMQGQAKQNFFHIFLFWCFVVPIFIFTHCEPDVLREPKPCKLHDDTSISPILIYSLVSRPPPWLKTSSSSSMFSMLDLGFVVSRAPPSSSETRSVTPKSKGRDALAEAEAGSYLMGICSTLGFFRCGPSNSMVTWLALERRRLKTPGSFLMKAFAAGTWTWMVVLGS